MTSEVNNLAHTLWEYMQLHMPPTKCDVIVGLGAHDIRIAERAADLYLEGYGDYLMFSGGIGRVTRSRFTRPEADIFAEIAQNRGVPPHDIIIENTSSNTGENIQFTDKVLKQHQIHPQSLLLVHKPYMERRTYATFKKQWPDPDTTISVTSPRLDFEAYCSPEHPKDEVISIMVGDLQRIIEYPKKGFQIPQTVPDSVLDAYQKLTKLGYTQHLLIGGSRKHRSTIL